MNKQELRNQQKQESVETAQQVSGTSAEREFANVEELLRHDAARNPTPPEVARKLENSLQNEPPPAVLPWWKRILGS